MIIFEHGDGKFIIEIEDRWFNEILLTIKQNIGKQRFNVAIPKERLKELIQTLEKLL